MRFYFGARARAILDDVIRTLGECACSVYLMTGKILMISMSLYGNALFPTALMRPPSRTYSLLPPPSAHELWHTFQVCLMQGTGLMWCHQHHWVFTFKTENSNAACGTGWEFLSKVIHFLAQNAGTLLTSLVITRLGVVETVTGFPGIMPYVTWSSLQPSLQPWPLPRRPLASLPAPSLAQLISFYPIGKGAVLQLWMSM